MINIINYMHFPIPFIKVAKIIAKYLPSFFQLDLVTGSFSCVLGDS